jgi:hypothetical protein
MIAPVRCHITLAEGSLRSAALAADSRLELVLTWLAGDRL